MHGVSGALVSRHYGEHLLASAFAGRLGEATREKACVRRILARREGGPYEIAGSRNAELVVAGSGSGLGATAEGWVECGAPAAQ